MQSMPKASYPFFFLVLILLYNGNQIVGTTNFGSFAKKNFLKRSSFFFQTTREKKKDSVMQTWEKKFEARFDGRGLEDAEQVGRSMENKKIPPPKTQSFREKKSWIRRQLSRQKSWEYDDSGVDYPTAVAAAAYAVKSLEESRMNNPKLEAHAPSRFSKKIKSKLEDHGIQPESSKSSSKIADEFSKAKFKDRDIKVPISSTSPGKAKPENERGIAPSMKQRASFGEINHPIDKTALKGPPTSADHTDLNITTESNTPEIRMPRAKAKSEPGDSMAEAWEKEEMASIRERYQKLMDTIEKWEGKKMTKAKRKMERREGEKYNRRTKTVQSYHDDITRIREVAGAARGQAEKNRRKEEIKVKEKADKIRLTGKMPARCLCF